MQANDYRCCSRSLEINFFFIVYHPKMRYNYHSDDRRDKMFKAVKNSVKSQIITVTSLCLIVLLMGIFFAAQSYSTAIDAVSFNKGNVNESLWKVAINKDSYKETEGSIPSTYTNVLSNSVINNVTLNNPSDFIEYTFMIENTGNIDAVLKNITIEGLNENVNTTIKVNTEDYDPSNEVYLEANSKNYVTVRVEYKETDYITPQELQLFTTVDIAQK